MKNPRQKEKKRGDMRRREKKLLMNTRMIENKCGDMRRRKGTFDEDKTRQKQEMQRYEKKKKKRDF